MGGLDFVNMESANHSVIHVPGFIYQVLAEAGEIYAFYFEGNGSPSIKIKIANGNYSVKWWNPEKGEMLKSETIKVKDNLIILNMPHIDTDIVLLIE